MALLFLSTIGDIYGDAHSVLYVRGRGGVLSKTRTVRIGGPGARGRENENLRVLENESVDQVHPRLHARSRNCLVCLNELAVVLNSRVDEKEEVHRLLIKP